MARSETANSGASATGSGHTIDLAGDQLLGHQQLGGEAVGLPLAQALGAVRVGAQVGGPAEHAVGDLADVQQEVADLVGDREAAPLPGLVLADPDLLAGRQQHPGERDPRGRARNRSEVIGQPDAKAAEALAELLDVDRWRVAAGRWR